MVEKKEAVIVLGCKDKELTKKRVQFVESKLKNDNNIKVIFSGTKEEIECMKKNSKLKAISEDKSCTTPENLSHSKKLIDNAEKVWIITDQSHALRTRYLARIILRGKTFEVIGIKMPATYMIKQIFYEWTRLIKHFYELG